MKEMSRVVETNFAASQESAATSEELNGQAQTLKNLVSQYKLRLAEDEMEITLK